MPKKFGEAEEPAMSSSSVVKPRRVTKPKVISPKKRRAPTTKVPASKTKKGLLLL